VLWVRGFGEDAVAHAAEMVEERLKNSD